jgi:GTP-binding protein HflX
MSGCRFTRRIVRTGSIARTDTDHAGPPATAGDDRPPATAGDDRPPAKAGDPRRGYHQPVQRSRHGRTRTSSFGADGHRPRGRARQRAYLIAALPDGEHEDLAELRELLRTAGVAAVGELVQRREHPHPNTYLGAGKLDELKADLARADANLVACDDELSPRQERNLEAALGLPVIDRTAIILDIFASHAHSAEGKLQVELAQLEYNLARMRGLWSHLERLGAGRIDGGIGTRGPGETQIETDRRLARDRIAALKRKLDQVHSSRAVMRAERVRAHLPRVALAGYTNAGKSTLLNALTGASAGVGDRLFHTLDPTTRVLRAGGRDYLLTDTVGFIRKLPHQLVEAFAATLEETRLADLILHVVDASVTEEELLAMTGAVEDVLHEIGADEAPRLLVLGKADKIDGQRRAELANRHPDAVLVSSFSGEGIAELTDRIEDEFARTLREMELLIPFDEGARLAELHEIAGDLEREETPEGVRVAARLPASVASRYGRFALESRP